MRDDHLPDAIPPAPRQPWWRRWFGQRSERVAEKYLRQKGHRVLTRNWRCPLGELDLITRQGELLIFVEVRSTAHQAGDSARDSVDAEKQRRLTILALAFIKRYRLQDVPARFAVVILAWPPNARAPLIEHYENAFPAQFDRSMIG